MPSPTPELPASVHRRLRDTFGHRHLLPGQRRVVSTLLAREDAIVVMPTGSGKSLCYQLPAVMSEGLTVVVSPLIALMQDQVSALRARGVAAAALHGLLSPGESSAALRLVSRRRLRLLYLSPERLAAPALRAVLARTGAERVVVDEAHCVITWGRAFRPDYLAIPETLGLLGESPVAAFTATATQAEQRAILNALGRPRAQRIVIGHDRPELYHAVRTTPTLAAKAAALNETLRRADGPVLVYTATRAASEQVARWLTGRKGVPAAAYHAGLDAEVRRTVQAAFVADRLRVVAATSAFGMGVDKPDVRAVVHWSVPFNLSDYYQAAGRAGRDGGRALSLLLFDQYDRRLRTWQIDAATPTVADLGALFIALASRSDQGVETDEQAVAAWSGVRVGRARAGLHGFVRAGIVRRVGTGGRRSWAIVRAPRAGELVELAAVAARHRAVRRRALAAMVGYATGRRCRRRTLLDHFGAPSVAASHLCCDVCASQPTSGRHAVGAGVGTGAPRLDEAPTATAKGDGRDEAPAHEAVVPAAGSGHSPTLSERVLQAVRQHDGQTSVRTLTTAVARNQGAPAGDLRVADIRAAVDRLVEGGLIVVFHGDGPARLALTRRGRAHANGASEIAESRTRYAA